VPTLGYIKNIYQKLRIYNDILKTFSQHWCNIYQTTFVLITFCQRWSNVDRSMTTINQQDNFQPMLAQHVHAIWGYTDTGPK